MITTENTRGVFAIHNPGEKRETRFITTEYKTLFTVSDGDYIFIDTKDGKRLAEKVQYIDAYHAVIGGNTYHICEFSEAMERIGAKVSKCNDFLLWDNYDDTIDSIAKDYLNDENIDVDESQAYDLAYETNDDDYMGLKAEFINLKSGRFLVIAKLGLWNGLHTGYKISKGKPEVVCFPNTDCDKIKYIVDIHGELKMEGAHHDGNNEYIFRRIKKDANEEDIDNICEDIYNGTIDIESIDKVSDKMGPEIAKIFNWKLPDKVLG